MSIQRFHDRMPVHTRVPYDTAILAWLYLRGVPLDDLAQRSRRYERAFLAWETIRSIRNPYFLKGTGFEGYFVGTCTTAEDVASQLRAVGRAMLDSNCRFYQGDYAVQSILMKTLRGDASDLKSIMAWAALLGATLARLRCNLFANDAAARFQAETYQLVNPLPAIRYHVCGAHIEQEYWIAAPVQGNGAKLPFGAVGVADTSAESVVDLIGRFGHPLLRQYLDEITSGRTLSFAS